MSDHDKMCPSRVKVFISPKICTYCWLIEEVRVVERRYLLEESDFFAAGYRQGREDGWQSAMQTSKPNSGGSQWDS